MADVAPELLEMILQLAIGGPHGHDFNAERDIVRMKLLKAASGVCRRWRAIAQPMLPACIVFTTVRRVDCQFALISRVTKSVCSTNHSTTASSTTR